MAGMWKAGAGEFSQLQEFCTSQKQEVEADVVSIRYVNVSFCPHDTVLFLVTSLLNGFLSAGYWPTLASTPARP